MDRSPETAADGGLVSPTRRELLAGAARAGALVSGAVLLGACGGSPAPSGTGGSASGGSSTSSGPHGVTELPGGTPRRGGTFTVGVLSGGQEENLFPGTPVGTPDFVRDYNLYNLLFYLGPNVTSLIPGLALSAESSTRTRRPGRSGSGTGSPGTTASRSPRRTSPTTSGRCGPTRR